MSRIKVMDRLLSNRIAAGEVIERPASVVKELAENSIDAGAAEITVEIERAGSRLIAVTDNGCGMDEEDAMLALQRHGTSKLLNESDLDHIMTLGFRGRLCRRSLR
jgi:DNA mismatch repair protein MutL